MAEGRGGRAGVPLRRPHAHLRATSWSWPTGPATRCSSSAWRLEDRVLMLCLDAPEFLGTFWGAIKIGAVPIPTNTLMRTADYLYFLNDSRAKVAVVSAPLLAEAGPALAEAQVPQARARRRRRRRAATCRYEERVGQGVGARSRRRRPRATTPRSGSTRRARPASPRAPCTCSTTWWCAGDLRQAGARDPADRPRLLRGQALLRLRARRTPATSRWAWARRAMLYPQRPDAGGGVRGPSRATGRRSSSASRPSTPRCWR